MEDFFSIQTSPAMAKIAAQQIFSLLCANGKDARTKGVVIVEACCGEGNLTRELQAAGYNNSVCGFDYYARSVEIAYAARVNVLRADANTFPFANRSVDMVVTCNVQDYTALVGKKEHRSIFRSIFPLSIDLERMIGEIYRVLKPGGIYVPYADDAIANHMKTQRGFRDCDRISHILFERI